MLNRIVLIILTAAVCTRVHVAVAQDNQAGGIEDHNQQASILQQDGKSGGGVSALYYINNHIADFNTLQGVPGCCPHYSEGHGTGYGIGVFYETRISKALSFLVRADYSVHDGLLKATENILLAGPNNEPTSGTIEHEIDASISSIGIEPQVIFRIFGSLQTHFGGRVGLFLTHSYEQIERLVRPELSGTFENGLRSRNATNGSIPEIVPVHAALTAGFRYPSPMNARGTLHVIPEIKYALGLTNLVRDQVWRASSIQAGVSIRLWPLKQEPAVPLLREVAPRREPAIVADAVYVLRTAVEATMHRDGTRSQASDVKVIREEIASQDMKPLLPYVFFEDGSHALPKRYHIFDTNEADGFREDELFALSALEAYRHILNIIGKRMQTNTHAEITLVGCNANTGKELNSLPISRARAERVKEYLVTTWQIQPSRIHIEARNLPTHYTKGVSRQADEENRRVEFHSSHWEIVAPLLTRSVQARMTPSHVRFRQQTISTHGVREWRLDITQNDVLVDRLTGLGPVPDTLEWDVMGATGNVPSAGGMLTYVLHVNDSAGQWAESEPRSLMFAHRKLENWHPRETSDGLVGRFSALLFDYDEAELTSAHVQSIDMISRELPPQSEIVVTGYADQLGAFDHNSRLALQRARSVSSQLATRGYRVTHLGASELLYDNQLPEGRMYCRTVTVDAEDPDDGK